MLFAVSEQRRKLSAFCFLQMKVFRISSVSSAFSAPEGSLGKGTAEIKHVWAKNSHGIIEGLRSPAVMRKPDLLF